MRQELPSRPADDIDGLPPRAQNTPSALLFGLLILIPKPRVTAVHVRHATHKATTQRDVRAASLRCTGRRRASAGKAAR